MISRHIPPFESYGTQVLFAEPTCNDLQDFETPLSFDTMVHGYPFQRVCSLSQRLEEYFNHFAYYTVQATGAQLLSPLTAFCKSQKPKIFIFRY